MSLLRRWNLSLVRPRIGLPPFMRYGINAEYILGQVSETFLLEFVHNYSSPHMDRMPKRPEPPRVAPSIESIDWLALIRDPTIDWARLVKETRCAAPEKLTQAEFAKRIGLKSQGQSTVSKWENGEQTPQEDRYRVAILQLAHKRHVRAARNATGSHRIAIIGRVIYIALVEFNPVNSRVEYAPMVDDATAATVALIVEGGAMAPTLDPGWILYYDDNRTPPEAVPMGELCVVRLRDGRTLVRKLSHRSNGLWTLVTPAGQFERDQDVEWAEEIFHMSKPRRH